MADHRNAFDDTFHERLGTHWPEPREQLHMGGWAATRRLVAHLNLAQAGHILDICCGEGSTACWLAETFEVRVTGVDIVEQAIVRARRLCAQERAQFVTADVFALPFPDAAFDVIIGQDPDGIAHHQRVDIFAECRRVLQPGGRISFQHWVLHDDAPAAVAARYDQINADLGFSFMKNLSVSHYVRDMQRAGFAPVQVTDLSSMYARHLQGIQQVAAARNQDVDAWTRTVLDIIDQGYKIGALLTAQR